MATCDNCGTTILFGGVREGNYRFCKKACRDNAYGLIATAAGLSDDLVAEQARKLHESSCPKCGGRGPVDMHSAHAVWSALVLTRWTSKSELSCQSCGTKAKWKALLSSSALGWWGFPWGLLVTPVQILRNISGFFKVPDPGKPSDQLLKLVRRQLSANVVRGDGASAALQDSPVAQM
jgi:hypothetical protein